MQSPSDVLDQLTHPGRIGLFERATTRDRESAVALASITAESAKGAGGRLAWAGHVDQTFIGEDASPAASQVLLSEYPSAAQAARALASRREWGEAQLAQASHISAFTPARAPDRIGTKIVFAVNRWRGRKTPTADLSQVTADEVFSADEGPAEFRPTDEALREYLTCGIEGKVTMLNLLRYKRDAAGSSKAGRDAYRRYGANTAPLIAGMGGAIRLQGSRVIDLQALDAPGWDSLVLVQYPSRADFIGMVTSERYHAGHVHRDAGLDRTTLLTCTSHATFF